MQTIVLLVAVLFFTMFARAVYSPLLPSIERDLHLTHTRAASFFLFIAFGYVSMNIVSGFIASRMGHRTTIFLAVLLVSSATVLIAVTQSLLLMRAELIVVGFGAGLYSPSGIATVSSLVHSRDEGKILSIHELGPNIAFIAAPLIVALLLPRMEWRSCLLLISFLGFLIGMLYIIFSRGGGFKGEAPILRNLSQIFSLPSFWVIAVLMALGAGASIGLFAIIPTYLVFERGLDQELVNTLVGVSRISGLIALLYAGHLVDRVGAKKLVSAALFFTGIATVALWVTDLDRRGICTAPVDRELFPRHSHGSRSHRSPQFSKPHDEPDPTDRIRFRRRSASRAARLARGQCIFCSGLSAVRRNACSRFGSAVPSQAEARGLEVFLLYSGVRKPPIPPE
jgi:NNP family nitrate/nitrite transporter-like MFS transporter